MRSSKLFTVLVLLSGSLPAVASPTWAQEPAQPEREARAVAAIETRGGSVYRDERAPGNPVTGITFSRSISDEDMELVKAFPRLESLSLMDGGITDAGLAPLAEMTQLRYLDIYRARITDEGLRHLGGLSRLERLTLSDVPITDAGLAPLERLPRLRWLSLSGTQVTDAGAAELKQALPYTLVDIGRAVGEESHRADGGSPLLRVAGILAWGGSAALLLFALIGRLRSRRPHWAWRLAAVLGLVLLMGAELLKMAPVMAPVRDGEAATFWLHACRIDVGARRAEVRGGSYQPRDGWFLYYVQGFHGQFLYRVSSAEALALFPAVVRKLQGAPPGALDADVEVGLREWLRADPGRTDAALLLAKLREARLARLQQTHPELHDYVLAEEDDFGKRWERAGRYAWNLVFEFVFLAGLILFAAWPWLRGGGPTRWAIHLGLLPLLFFLPFWLGYARLTFTSAGPSGGVLYPWLLSPFRGLGWTALDTAIVRRLPQVLEPLSQTPGPMLSLSGFGAVGPVAATVMSIVLGGLVFGAGEALRRARRPRDVAGRPGTAPAGP
jgi:hypothetical protein